MSSSSGGGKGGSAQGLADGGRGQTSNTAGQLARELAQRQHVDVDSRVLGDSSRTGWRVKKGLGASARGSSTDKGTPGRCRNDIAIAVVTYINQWHECVLSSPRLILGTHRLV